MAQKQDVLEAAVALTVERGTSPSLAEVARAVGLTKQGVLHYFPSRSALDEAVILRAVDRVDAAMDEASRSGSPVATYLRLASPSGDDWVAIAVLVAGLRRGSGVDLAAVVEPAIARWQAMIADEVGDPVRAEVARLVGDALFGEALLTGAPPAPERVDRLVAHLRAPARTTPA